MPGSENGVGGLEPWTLIRFTHVWAVQPRQCLKFWDGMSMQEFIDSWGWASTQDVWPGLGLEIGYGTGWLGLGGLPRLGRHTGCIAWVKPWGWIWHSGRLGSGRLKLRLHTGCATQSRSGDWEGHRQARVQGTHQTEPNHMICDPGYAWRLNMASLRFFVDFHFHF